MKFNVALIGLGKIGLLFDTDIDTATVLSHAKAIYNHKGFHLKYAVDINKDNCNKIKKMFPDAEIFSQWTDLSDKDIDLAVIALPTEFHYSCLSDLSKNTKIKLFLTEKPLFLVNDNFDSLSNAVKEKIVVNYIYKFHPKIKELSESFIKDSKINKVICSYTKGIKHNGSHLIDLINHFFDNPSVIEVKVLNKINDNMPDDITLDCMLKIRYQSSIISVYFMGYNYNDYSIYSIDFYSEKGRLEFSNYFRLIQKFNIIEDPEYPGYNILETVPKTETIDLSTIMMFVYNHLYAQLIGKEINISSINNEKNNFTMIEKIFNEVKNGKISN